MKTSIATLIKAIVCKAVLCLISLFNCPPTLAASADNMVRRLDTSEVSMDQTKDFLLAAMQRHRVPGMSIAVINEGEIRYHHQLGLADIEQNRAVTKTTTFEAASLSKPVFAFMVMKSVESGKLDLDQPLYRYLRHPDLPLDDNARLLTARMVLSHTSGLPNWRSETKDKTLRFITTPGQQHSYSGEAFQYLAMVLAKVENTTAKGLERKFQQWIARPLKMQQTHFFTPLFERKNKAMPYSDNKRLALNPRPKDFGAAYAIETEARDYALWISALMNQKGLEAKTFRDFFAEQHTSIPADHPERRLGLIDWSLGFSIYQLPDQSKLFVHGGNNEGYTSLVLFSLEHKWGLVLMTNADQAKSFLLEVIGYWTQAPKAQTK